MMATRFLTRFKACLAILLTAALLPASLPRQNAGPGLSIGSPSDLVLLVTPEKTPVPVVTPIVMFPISSPTPTGSAPLRFTLPTPDGEPVSLWRPPLYRVPWALGPFDHFYFSRPIAADEVNWPLADYRYGGIFTDTTIVHTGIDIDAPKGTPVLAAADGTVVWAGYGLFYGNHDSDDPYGLAVTIRHNFGLDGQRLYTVYAHMDRIDVITGQDVLAGQALGVVGETGNTTGPHLHFEVRVKNNSFFTTLNPELWLAPPQGWGVLTGRMENTNGSLLESQDVTVRSKESGRKWVVRSYGPKVVNGDPYYKENMVLSDLPAGNYEVTIDYLEKRFRRDITIQPGAAGKG
ncbi:MAG TPA: M23 family metallopeptidase [Anaerolineales bacterium]